MKEAGSSTKPNGDCSITISGTKAEIDQLRQMMCGAAWVRQADVGVVSVNRFEPLPAPEADPLLAEHWQRSEKQPSQTVVNHASPGGYHSPGYYASHLCGYGWTPERYAQECRRFTSFGFQCMRSRRGEDGRIWEVWYLPGNWAARGELKKFVEDQPKDLDWDAMSLRVVHFLCRNGSFGSLDVTCQRAAMSMDD